MGGGKYKSTGYIYFCLGVGQGKCKPNKFGVLVVGSASINKFLPEGIKIKTNRHMIGRTTQTLYSCRPTERGRTNIFENYEGSGSYGLNFIRSHNHMVGK